MALTEKLGKFSFVTVFNPTFYEATDTTESNPLFTLDSLRVANLTQEGPTKTSRGGLYANTLVRYGKTMRLEMEDVIGRVDALEQLMGVSHTDASAPTEITESTIAAVSEGDTFNLQYAPDGGILTSVEDGNQTALNENTGYYLNGRVVTFNTTATDVVIKYNYTEAEKYSITTEFATPKRIKGSTFVIDENGAKQWIFITIPNFLPDSTFNIELQSEGDFGVININGEVQANECGEFMFFSDDNSTHTC